MFNVYVFMFWGDCHDYYVYCLCSPALKLLFRAIIHSFIFKDFSRSSNNHPVQIFVQPPEILSWFNTRPTHATIGPRKKVNQALSKLDSWSAPPFELVNWPNCKFYFHHQKYLLFGHIHNQYTNMSFFLHTQQQILIVTPQHYYPIIIIIDKNVYINRPLNVTFDNFV